MPRTLFLFFILSLLFIPSLSSADDHDERHITFINMTRHNVKFTVDIRADYMHYTDSHNKSKNLSPREAKYITIGKNQCRYNDTFKINMKGKNIDKTISRGCGESLYLYWDKGSQEYKTSHKYNKHMLQAERDKPDEFDSNKPSILFAHGYKSNPKVWNTYAKRAKEEGWNVFRTAVSYNASIEKRGSMLSDYINVITTEHNLKKDSLRVVGHSMGGLDLRYITTRSHHYMGWEDSHGQTCSPTSPGYTTKTNTDCTLVKKGPNKYGNASKTIERLYTIATPHKGNMSGGFFIHPSDAADSLGKSQMQSFNKDYPWSTLKKRDQWFCALTFSCVNGSLENATGDGVVSLYSQTLKGAPRAHNRWVGKHTGGIMTSQCNGDVSEELENTGILLDILDSNSCEDTI